MAQNHPRQFPYICALIAILRRKDVMVMIHAHLLPTSLFRQLIMHERSPSNLKITANLFFPLLEYFNPTHFS
jgi:hypothetical protein